MEKDLAQNVACSLRTRLGMSIIEETIMKAFKYSLSTSFDVDVRLCPDQHWRVYLEEHRNKYDINTWSRSELRKNPLLKAIFDEAYLYCYLDVKTDTNTLCGTLMLKYTHPNGGFNSQEICMIQIPLNKVLY